VGLHRGVKLKSGSGLGLGPWLGCQNYTSFTGYSSSESSNVRPVI